MNGNSCRLPFVHQLRRVEGGCGTCSCANWFVSWDTDTLGGLRRYHIAVVVKLAYGDFEGRLKFPAINSCLQGLQYPHHCATLGSHCDILLSGEHATEVVSPRV